MEQTNIGIIEGFYGPTWSWEDRDSYLPFLKRYGYSFYIYAPKSDQILRKKWSNRWDPETLARLKHFRERCREFGISFGIGLSPYEVFIDYDGEKRTVLCNKVSSLHDELGPDLLCILFDDMHGSYPSLARTQIDIMRDVAQHSPNIPLVMCPTYYTTQPLLQELFGAMPEGYLSDLGRGLPTNVHLFWTGEKICSTEYSEEHLLWVNSQIGRKPFLWDNYPVNDDRAMSPFLHLNPFSGRGAFLREYVIAHAVNPMMQPNLSKIPLATLQRAMVGEASAEELLTSALREVCGDALAGLIWEDLELFTTVGMKDLNEDQKAHLYQRYGGNKGCPFSQEIVAWLDGVYLFQQSWLV